MSNLSAKIYEVNHLYGLWKWFKKLQFSYFNTKSLQSITPPQNEEAGTSQSLIKMTGYFMDADIYTIASHSSISITVNHIIYTPLFL